MKDIEFRAKSKESNEWVYGYLVKSSYGNYYITKELDNFVWVDKDTIGQYTGLKDKNGTKIFEGDIVKINNINYRVLYSKYRLSFVFLRLEEETCYFSLDEILEDYYKENPFSLLDIEVIGNIYDESDVK